MTAQTSKPRVFVPEPGQSKRNTSPIAHCLRCDEYFIERKVDFCPLCGEPVTSGTIFSRSRPGLLLKRLSFKEPPIEGGLSLVYPTHHPDTKAPLAVKVSKRDAITNTRAWELLMMEGVMLHAVAHPNIPRLYEQGRLANDSPYIITDHIPGNTLQHVIDTFGPSSSDATSAIGFALCDVLTHIHSKGVLHRDIKPGNIILSRGAKPFIIDFGTAVFLDESVERAITGTTWYMPPEQVLSRKLTFSSDIYALGVSLYQLRSGRLPFDTQDPEHAAILKVAQDPPPISSVAPDTPPELARTIMNAIARDPMDRFATMDEFRQNLAKSLRGLR